MKNPPVLNFMALTAGFLLLLFSGCSSAPPPPEEINVQRNKAADFTKFGNQYYDQAQFDQALNFFLLALQSNTAIDNLPGIASSWNSLGKTYLAQGLTDEAERSFLEAAAVGKFLDSAEIRLQGINNLAELKIRRGLVDEAVRDLEEVLGAKDLPQTKEIAVLAHSLGAAYRKQDSQELNAKALAQFEKAALINRNLKLYQELASNLYMAASVYLKGGDLTKAASTAQEALANDRKMENSLGIAQDLRLLGEISFRKGDMEEAAQYHLRSFRVFQALEMKDQQVRSMDLLIPVLEKAEKASEVQLYRNLRKDLAR